MAILRPLSGYPRKGRGLIVGSQMQETPAENGEIVMGFWAAFGQLVLLAILLGAVTTVVDSVLGLVGLGAMIKKIPVVGSNWSLIISVLMMWVIPVNPLSYWGITLDGWGGWMGYIGSGAIVYGMIPMKDAVISMVGKGFRM